MGNIHWPSVLTAILIVLGLLLAFQVLFKGRKLLG